MKVIEKIDRYDMPSTIQLHNGFEMVAIPEATKENMEVLVEKINELINAVNILSQGNKQDGILFD